MNVLEKNNEARIAVLQQKYKLSKAEIIEQALSLMEQDTADWEAIFTLESVNQDLTEDEAYSLAMAEVRQYRNAKT
jgi:hypothetical protein